MEAMDTRAEEWTLTGQRSYIDSKFLMSSPVPVTCILAAYLWFVLKAGPTLMRDKKPYKLDKILVLYNFSQVLLSCYLVVKGLPRVVSFGLYHAKCYSELESIGKQITDGTYLYFLAKVVELLDTIFFVLRKKQSQVTFLHVYHHTLMAFATWFVVKYSITDSIVFIGGINSLVHIVMYSYYALSVFPALAPYLWWKKYITIMQLVQFCLMFLHMVISNFVSECKPNHVLMFAICSNTVIFFYLFGNFYIKSYTEKRKIKMDTEIKDKNTKVKMESTNIKNMPSFCGGMEGYTNVEDSKEEKSWLSNSEVENNLICTSRASAKG